MRNRLNVTFNGKRTTARFPDYLWRLALIATGCDDDQLSCRTRDMLSDMEGLDSDATASFCVIWYLTDAIEAELTLVGFNPDSSRAPVPGNAPRTTAAEASPNSGNH